jgi:hypothetical protein
LIGEPRHRFAQGQRGALSVIEVRRLSPCRDSKEAFIRFTSLLGVTDAAIDAETTAIDLAGAQMDETKRLLRNVAFMRDRIQGLQRFIASGRTIAGFFIRACIFDLRLTC